MRKKTWCLPMAAFGALLLLLVSAGVAVADPLAAGREKMAAGDYDGAYEAFFEVFKQDPATSEINFLLGRAAFESGRMEEAAMAFERVLISRPDSNRAKLELARTYMALNSRELARRYFLEVLATNPPEAVWQNIQRSLAIIDESEQRHFISGLFTVGVGYDDNVKVAPVSDSITSNFGVSTINNDKTKNYLLNTHLVLNHVYQAGLDNPWNWKTTFTNYNAFHETANDRDINLYGIGTGPVWRQDRLMLQGTLFFNHLDLGFDRYLGVTGVAGNATHRFHPRLTLTGGVTVQHKNYHQNSDKDATNVALTLGSIFHQGPDRITISVGYENEDADVNQNNSYDRRRITLRYDRRLPLDFAMYFSFRIQETDYKGAPNGFDRRRDDALNLSGGLSRVLWRSDDRRYGLSGQLRHTRTEVDSTVPLYEYKRNVSVLSVTYTF